MTAARRAAPLFALLAACAAPHGIEVRDADVRIAPAAATTAALYFTVHNGGAVGDTLRSVSGAPARAITLHESMDHGDGTMMMMPLAWVAIGPGDSVAFRQGGRHAMLEDFTRPPVVGDTLTLVFRFAVAGERTLRVPVRPVGGEE